MSTWSHQELSARSVHRSVVDYSQHFINGGVNKFWRYKKYVSSYQISAKWLGRFNSWISFYLWVMENSLLVAFFGEFLVRIATDKLSSELVFIHYTLTLHTGCSRWLPMALGGIPMVLEWHCSVIKAYQPLTTETSLINQCHKTLGNAIQMKETLISEKGCSFLFLPYTKLVAWLLKSLSNNLYRKLLHFLCIFPE